MISYVMIYPVVYLLKKREQSSIEEDTNGMTPFGIQLSQNYPNPFFVSTTIPYSISKPQHVKLDVYDILGRRVAMLVNEQQPAGNYWCVRHARQDDFSAS